MQLGELLCNPDSMIQDHRQRCFEITYIFSGTGHVSTGDTVYAVRTGDCVLSLPNERHRIETSREQPLRFAFVGFNPDVQSKYLQTIFDQLHETIALHGIRVANLPSLSDTLIEMLSEIKSEAPFYKDKIGFSIAEILIAFIRSFCGEKYHEYAYRITNQSVLVYSMQNYITKNMCAIVNLKDLQEQFHYRYSYLARIFQRVTGESPAAFLHKQRMQKAKVLLAQGNSVTDVGELLGYSSIHPFTRSFRNYFCITPTDYQKSSGVDKPADGQ